MERLEDFDGFETASPAKYLTNNDILVDFIRIKCAADLLDLDRARDERRGDSQRTKKGQRTLPQALCLRSIL